MRKGELMAGEKRREPSQETRRRPTPPWSPWVPLSLFVLLWVLLRGISDFSGRTEISYTRFRNELESGNVVNVVVSGQEIRGRLGEAISLDQGDSDAEKVSSFETFIPPMEDDGDLLSTLQSQNVEIVAEPTSGGEWWITIVTLAPFLLIGLLVLLGIRQMRLRGGGLFSMGKSPAKLYQTREQGVTFEDVAAAGSAKAELGEVVSFLRDPGRVGRLGARMPKGVLLVGAPGTGKTLLARATAGEAGVPFFIITGSDFMEMFVGVGASRVRDLFEQAKKSAPSIIFIDELDSIGRHRGAGLGGGHDEREQTLNQLLSEMDGFEPNQGVIVIAATNRPDILDPALTRPGRFDRRVQVELPTTKDRLAILKIHAREKPIANEVNLGEVARSTPGFSGADLANLLNEAALLAARDSTGEAKERIGPRDIELARDKIVMGLKRENLTLTKEDCELLAYHEAGHAIVAAVLPNADRVHKVTIVPRGHSMGHTQQLPRGDRYLYDKAYLLDRLAVMMGGRAAEVGFRGVETNGAEEDLKQATRLAKTMVLSWGMGEGLSQVAFGDEGDEVFLGRQVAKRPDYSEATAREVDQAVRALLEEAYERAHELLDRHEDVMERLVEALIDQEEISGTEIEDMIATTGVTENRRAEAG